MTCISRDLTIDGVLADPMIAAAMRADHVDPRLFETLLRATARELDRTRRPASLASLVGQARSSVAGFVQGW